MIVELRCELPCTEFHRPNIRSDRNTLALWPLLSRRRTGVYRMRVAGGQSLNRIEQIEGASNWPKFGPPKPQSCSRSGARSAPTISPPHTIYHRPRTWHAQPAAARHMIDDASNVQRILEFPQLRAPSAVGTYTECSRPPRLSVVLPVPLSADDAFLMARPTPPWPAHLHLWTRLPPHTLNSFHTSHHHGVVVRRHPCRWR